MKTLPISIKIPRRIPHACSHAQGNGSVQYICELTGKSCPYQYFCNEHNYWKHSVQINCEEFESK